MMPVTKWRFRWGFPTKNVSCHPGGDWKFLVGGLYPNHNNMASKTPLVTHPVPRCAESIRWLTFLPGRIFVRQTFDWQEGFLRVYIMKKHIYAFSILPCQTDFGNGLINSEPAPPLELGPLKPHVNVAHIDERGNNPWMDCRTVR